MLLFSTQNRIDASFDKSNIALPFNVPNGVKELVISYSYSPKTVDDAKELLVEKLKFYGEDENNYKSFLPVNNLITLSFDDENGYRGACHRQANEQKIVIGKTSTAGIIDGKITEGEWKITLNVHFIGCEVEYKIKVEGVEA